MALTLKIPPVKPRRGHCAICRDPCKLALQYLWAVCGICDTRAVTAAHRPAGGNNGFDHGENPVYIDGLRCWRRYRFGVHVTMRDFVGADRLSAFYVGWEAAQALETAQRRAKRAGKGPKAPTKKAKKNPLKKKRST